LVHPAKKRNTHVVSGSVSAAIVVVVVALEAFPLEALKRKEVRSAMAAFMASSSNHQSALPGINNHNSSQEKQPRRRREELVRGHERCSKECSREEDCSAAHLETLTHVV